MRVEVLEWAKLLPSTWDGLVGPQDPLHPTRRLETAEPSLGGTVRYVLGRRGEMLVAGAVVTLAASDAGWTVGRPDVLLASQVHAPDQLMPSLVVGGRQPGASRLLTHPTITAAEVEAMVREIERLALELGAASVAYPFVDFADPLLREALSSYESFLSGRQSLLTVPSGREAVPPRRLEGETSIGVEPLYGIDWQSQPATARFKEVLEIFGSDAFTLTARRHGELTGFVLVLCHQDRWYALGSQGVQETGFDSAESLHERLIEEAAAAGISTVHYGPGTEASHRQPGVQVSDQHCFIKIRVRGEL